MRLGLFGGSFDPVHYGHLLLAECCREQCRLDQVCFLPAGTPPHKRGRSLTPGIRRIEMLQLAVAGHEAFHVSRYEVDRGGISYTVDTLRHFQDDGRELFFLMGADMLHDLPTWREAAAICQLAVLVAVGRAGVPGPDFRVLAGLAAADRVALFQRHQVRMPLVEISSSEIRRRVAQGQSVRYWTPRSVERYIHSHGLYRRPPHAKDEHAPGKEG